MKRVRGKTSRGGFTLVEVMVSLVILVLAITGYSGAIVSTSLSADTTREMRTATEAAWSVMEELKGANFDEVFALYNSDGEDDPIGAGSAPGADFDLEELAAVEGDWDGQIGEILMPAVWINGDLQIREDIQMPELGLPRDLNGDGLVDNADHSTDYTILPILVRLQWAGSGGETELEFRTTLVGL